MSWSVLVGPSVLAVGLYLNTLHAGFVYDDNRAVLNNADVLPGTPLTNLLYDDYWGTPLTDSGSHGSYRPITVLTFRLNHFLGGFDPFGYHLTNVFLHASATALYSYAVRKVAHSDYITLMSGLLFAAHPIHVEAVAGVVGRAELLAAIFFLAAFLSYMKYHTLRESCACSARCAQGGVNVGASEMSVDGRRRWLFFAASSLFCLASMLSKEHGITVFCVCAIYDIANAVTLSSKHCPCRKFKVKRLLEGLTAVTLVAATFALLRFKVMNFTRPEFSASDNPAADSPSLRTRTLTFLYLPCVNTWLLLCPAILSFDWSMDAIALIETCSDLRNCFTLIFYVVLLSIIMLQVILFLKALSTQQFKLQTAHVRQSNGKREGQTVYESNHRYATHNDVNCETSLYDDTVYHQKHVVHNCDITCKKSTCISSDFKSGHPEVVSEVNPATDERTTFDTSIPLALALLICPFIPASNLFFYVGFVVAERVLYIPSMGFCLLVATGVHKLRLGMARGSVIRSRLISFLAVVLVASHSVRTVLRNADWLSEYNLYASGVAVNPAKAWGNLANILRAEGKLADAEKAYKLALQSRSNMADVHYNLGILYQDMERLPESMSSYLMAIQCRPNLTPAYLNLGIVYSVLGMKVEAVEMLRRCNATNTEGLRDPKLHEHSKISALYHLGRLLSDDNQPLEAVEVFREALARRPADYSPHSLYNLLGEAYFKLEQFVEAERMYELSLIAKPDHIPAHLTMAKLMQHLNKLELAESWYMKAERLDAHDANLQQFYGSYLSDVGRYEEAATHYVAAVEKLPKNFEVIFNAANTLRQAGRNGEAELFYRKALQLNPQEVVALMNLGAMLHYNGKLEEAEAVYLEALKLKPSDRVLQSNLDKLRRLIARRGKL